MILRKLAIVSAMEKKEWVKARPGTHNSNFVDPLNFH